MLLQGDCRDCHAARAGIGSLLTQRRYGRRTGKSFPSSWQTIAQTEADTASNLLNGSEQTEGATLESTAVTSSAYQVTFANGTEENPHTGQAIDPPTCSVEKNSAGGVDMTINGETVSFATPADLSATTD